jgi:predicted nucleic acid-binding protein
MAPQLLIDASVVVKWKLTSEPQAAEALELLVDWEQGTIEACVPDQLFAELVNAMLGSYRKHPPRLTQTEAQDALQDLLSSPFTVFKSTGRGLLARAFAIAAQHHQRAYDSIYIALAERKHVEFWTGDQRLYNALHLHYPFVRWIGNYQRKRPGP